MTTKSDLLQLLESDRDQHIQLLQALIRAPSPNPPGDTRAAIEIVRTYLASQDIGTEIIAPREQSPNLVSVFRGGSGEAEESAGRSIVLNGHIDQFPIEDAELWQRDPYSGALEDGYVHGRSGVDMKAGTAASILAFSYLHQVRAQLGGRCTLEVVSDEETGGKFGTRYLLEGEDGRRSGEWKGDCVLIGEPGGLRSIRFGEKGTLRLTMIVSASGGHGAYVHRSEGAIRIAARLIRKLVELEQHPGRDMDESLKEYMQRPSVKKVADDIMGQGASDAMLIPTVNIGTISGGAKINMIPSECVFEVDIRIPIGMKTADIQSRVDQMLESFPTARYTIHENHSHVPTHSQPDHTMARLLQENAEFLGREKPVPICSLGATDCKHFRRHGVPAYAYGPSPDGMAGRDEKISVEEFCYLVKMHTLTAWDYLISSEYELPQATK